LSYEEEFKQIEHEIRKLKIQYDLYFAGNAPRPPNDQKETLARQLRRYQGASFPNLADRFLYNTIVNKFNTFQELWTKMLRIREEGARVHPLAVRAARRAMKADTGGSTGPIPPLQAGADAASGAGSNARRAAGRPGQAAKGGDSQPAPDFWRVSPDKADPGALRALYESFVAARKRCGEDRMPGFDSFARDVARHAQSIKSKADCSSVEFRIYSKDNKVTLKARPVSGSTSKDKG
jgi:hypothetical protein